MANFKSDNSGTWFFYDSENESEGGICLRELSTEEYDRIEKLTVTIKKKWKHGQPYDDRKEDERLARRLRFDFCIVDWKKTSLDNVELECDTDNKVKMMKILDFAKFVANSLSDLTDANKSLEEARAKNFGTTSNGKLKSPIVKTV